MVRLGGLLRRSPRDKSETQPANEPSRKAADGAPIIVMIPDVAGVSSFRIYTYPDARGAVRFLSSLTRQQRERAHAFWALQHEPTDTLEGEDASGEAMVLIRSAEGSDLVYIVSFLDIESAQSFARFEVKRGMHLGLILVYWASMVNVVLNEDGSVQLIPEFPPRIDKHRQRTAATAVQAPRLPSLADGSEAEEVVPAEQAPNGLQRMLAEADEKKAREEEAEERRLQLESEAAEQRQLATAAEELSRLEAEAAEQQRLEAEAAEQRRLEAEAERRRLEAEAEEQRRLEGDAEQRRLEAEAEQRRLEMEAEEQRRLEAEAERRRLEAESEQRRLEVEAEQRRLAAQDEEQRRLQAEAEQQRRLEAEAEQLRLEAEEEERRLAAEAEQRRLEAEAEEQRRLEAEAEQRRLEAEAEEQRQLAAEEERNRLEAEAEEQRRLEAEEELARMAAEADAERQRVAAEMEEQRRLEAERLRLEAEEEEQRRFEAQKRAIFAAAQEEELAAASARSSDETAIRQAVGEPANPIEALLEREAAARVEIPNEFARKPLGDASEEPEAEGDDEMSGIEHDVSKILRKRRWEKRESPFEGFKSPPGRF